MNDIKRKNDEDRSTPVWAYVLIGIGAIWLLINLGIIEGIWRFWPLLLVVIGVYMLLGKTLPGARTAVTERFIEPVEDAEGAQIQLKLSMGETHIKALNDANTLIDAEVTHLGDIDFVVSGDVQKFIQLSGREQAVYFNPFNWWRRDGQHLGSRIALNPQVPISLDIHGGVGESHIDLRHMRLTHLKAAVGVGEMELTLPMRGKLYETYISGGVGDFEIKVPDGAEINAEIHGGVGDLEVELGDGAYGEITVESGMGDIKITGTRDAAVRVEVADGMGDVNIAKWFTRVQNDGDYMGKRGIWETRDFANADKQIIIHCKMGMGDIEVR